MKKVTKFIVRSGNKEMELFRLKEYERSRIYIPLPDHIGNSGFHGTEHLDDAGNVRDVHYKTPDNRVRIPGTTQEMTKYADKVILLADRSELPDDSPAAIMKLSFISKNFQLAQTEESGNMILDLNKFLTTLRNCRQGCLSDLEKQLTGQKMVLVFHKNNLYFLNKDQTRKINLEQFSFLDDILRDREKFK